LPVRLWLDDQLDDPVTPERHTPPGWTGVKTTFAACRALARGPVDHISFDHDLGEGRGSGYIVARFIEHRAFLRTLPPLTWDVHSANPAGRANIVRAMEQAERFWRGER
jgi:hypothetical protein